MGYGLVRFNTGRGEGHVVRFYMKSHSVLRNTRYSEETEAHFKRCDHTDDQWDDPRLYVFALSLSLEREA